MVKPEIVSHQAAQASVAISTEPQLGARGQHSWFYSTSSFTKLYTGWCQEDILPRLARPTALLSATPSMKRSLSVQSRPTASPDDYHGLPLCWRGCGLKTSPPSMLAKRLRSAPGLMVRQVSWLFFCRRFLGNAKIIASTGTASSVKIMYM